MYDLFEEFLWDLFKVLVFQLDDDVCLGWVLKIVNCQVGVGDLFSFMGYWLQVLMIGINNGLLYLVLVFCIFVKNVFFVDKVE